jgi:hypothetical protein
VTDQKETDAQRSWYSPQITSSSRAPSPLDAVLNPNGAGAFDRDFSRAGEYADAVVLSVASSIVFHLSCYTLSRRQFFVLAYMPSLAFAPDMRHCIAVLFPVPSSRPSMLSEKPLTTGGPSPLGPSPSSTSIVNTFSLPLPQSTEWRCALDSGTLLLITASSLVFNGFDGGKNMNT